MNNDKQRKIVLDYENVGKILERYKNPDDPSVILGSVNEHLTEAIANRYEILSTNDLKAVSVFELSNNVLMTRSIPEEYRTFAIQMHRDLICDYHCQTAGEKSVAEVAAINFVRVLDLQKRANDLFDRQEFLFFTHNPKPKDPFYGEMANKCTACERSELVLKQTAFLNRALGQANRNYLMAINTLRVMRQVPLNINIKTSTAVVGQNQMVKINQ